MKNLTKAKAKQQILTEIQRFQVTETFATFYRGRQVDGIKRLEAMEQLVLQGKIQIIDCEMAVNDVTGESIKIYVLAPVLEITDNLTPRKISLCDFPKD